MSNGERRQRYSQSLLCSSVSFDGCQQRKLFLLGYIVDRILKNFTMSFTSSDSEMNFASEDSEINFIRGYEIAAERDVLFECL